MFIVACHDINLSTLLPSLFALCNVIARVDTDQQNTLAGHCDFTSIHKAVHLYIPCTIKVER